MNANPKFLSATAHVDEAAVKPLPRSFRPQPLSFDKRIWLLAFFTGFPGALVAHPLPIPLTLSAGHLISP